MEEILYERERESSEVALLKFGSIVFWEVGVVILRSVNMTLILTPNRNIRNIKCEINIKSSLHLHFASKIASEIGAPFRLKF